MGWLVFHSNESKDGFVFGMSFNSLLGVQLTSSGYWIAQKWPQITRQIYKLKKEIGVPLSRYINLD